jgi:hypothetical protein
MGLAQAMTLAVVPWTAMYVTARLTGKADSAHNAVCHLALLAGGGMLFYGLALLVSSAVEGEYAAPLVSLGLVFAMAILADGALRPYNPVAFIQAADYMDRQSMQFAAAFPWGRLAVSLGVAAVLTGASVKAIERREF